MEASPPCRRPRPPSPASSLGPLPPEILQTIISHLPIRDAVRTSAVSRAWRRLWETTPDLALEWGCGTDLAVADAVLARYSGPVRSFNFFLRQEARPFELFPSYEEAFERADDWITILAGKGVRSLTLGFSEDSDDLPHTLQTTLFSCRELTRLRLCNCDFPLVPEESVRFPNLTWCSLDSVGFKYAGEKDVVALISGSPLLEVLWLKDPYFPYDENSFKKGCVIEAPNLRHLKIVSEDDFGWKMGELPSIETVEINIKDYDINRDFVQLMTALAEVKKLILKMPSRWENVLGRLSCSFRNLKSLSLHTDFCWFFNVLAMICLLKNAPNLEELSFKIQCENLQLTPKVSVAFLNGQWTEGLLANLKSVNMYLATCQTNEMHFIKFLLSKAGRLQDFDICLHEHCPKSNGELLMEISKYKRASPKAEIFLDRLVFA